MRRTSFVLLGLWLAIAVSMPAGAASREQLQMMADIRLLQEQNAQLQLALVALVDGLKTVTVRLDDQGTANRRGFADQKTLADGMASDLRVLREKLDETNVRLTALSQDVDGLREIIPQMAVPSAPAPGFEPSAAPAGGAAPVAPPVPVSPGTTPRRLYETAYADYTAGQWSLAIQGFETYLKSFPKSELADDAQYYIGEAYSGDGKFREAVAAYEKAVRDHPQGDILPEAWYKVGTTYDRLGMTDRAREAFEHVVRTYPDTDAGRLARQNLDRLSRRPR